MKKIFYYVMALALGCSQMSCSDLLDQKPQGVLTEDDLTGGTYETQIFNMYAFASWLSYCFRKYGIGYSWYAFGRCGKG